MSNSSSHSDGLAVHSEYGRRLQVGERTFGSRCSLANMVKELDRQKASKHDFIADSRSLEVIVQNDSTNNPVLCLAPKTAQVGEWFPDGPVPLGYDAIAQLGHRSSAVKGGVPTRWLRNLLKEHPDECARHLSELLVLTSRKRLIRCLDNRVRAFLSNRYKIWDHYDFAFAALDTARAFGGEVLEAQLTDKHMRLKMTTKETWDIVHTTRSSDDGNWYAGALGNQTLLNRVAARRWDDLPGGPDTVTPLVTIEHSETGHGGLNIKLGILAGICFNLATVQHVVRERHLGGEIDEGVLSDEARSADSEAVRLKARDYITTAFEPERFKALIAEIKASQTDEIAAPAAAVDNAMKALSIGENKRDELLAYFIRDYEPTRFGLAQAVGRLAQDTDNPDEATRLEEAAGELLIKRELVAV